MGAIPPLPPLPTRVITGTPDIFPGRRGLEARAAALRGRGRGPLTPGSLPQWFFRHPSNSRSMKALRGVLMILSFLMITPMKSGDT
jgi:hypothetical protein